MLASARITGLAKHSSQNAALTINAYNITPFSY